MTDIQKITINAISDFIESLQKVEATTRQAQSDGKDPVSICFEAIMQQEIQYKAIKSKIAKNGVYDFFLTKNQ